MRTKKIKWNVLVVFTMFVLMLTAFPAVVSAAEAPEAQAVTETQTAAQASERQNQHILAWAVFFIAFGEFAGLIGQGLNHMHSEKRRQKKQEALQRQSVYSPSYDSNSKNSYYKAS